MEGSAEAEQRSEANLEADQRSEAKDEDDLRSTPKTDPLVPNHVGEQPRVCQQTEANRFVYYM